MRRTLVAAPASEPLTVAEAKRHCRLGTTDGEPPPLALAAALAGSGAGNVDDGAHLYRVTFVTNDGETEGGIVSASLTVSDKSSDGKVSLTAIPIGGGAATSRKIYRTDAGASTYKLLTTIADNTTTTYTDNTADSGLGAAAPTTNTTLDPAINRLIIQARKWAEGRVRGALVTQTWDFFFDTFPAAGERMFEVPFPPLQSVTSIKYTDVDGATQTLSSANYTVDAADKRQRGRIVPAWGKSWPAVRGVINAVTVRVVIGFGDPADVPEPIRGAIGMAIATWWNNREDLVIGTTVAKIPPNAEWMLEPYRSIRFGGEPF